MSTGPPRDCRVPGKQSIAVRTLIWLFSTPSRKACFSYVNELFLWLTGATLPPTVTRDRVTFCFRTVTIVPRPVLASQNFKEPKCSKKKNEKVKIKDQTKAPLMCCYHERCFCATRQAFGVVARVLAELLPAQRL